MIQDIKVYIHFFGGGLACIVLGFILLSFPDVEWWRAVAAFPLGLIFIYFGFKYFRSREND